MKVVRRPLFAWFPVTAGAAAYGLTFWLPLWRPDGDAPALACATLALFFWILGWDSTIRFTATHLSTTNFLVTSTVRWHDVAEVTLEDGLHIQLRDGREMGSIAFGSSLIGAFTGYPTYRKAHELLRDAHRQAPSSGAGDGPAGMRWSVKWRRPLAASAAIYGPVLVLIACS